MNNFQQFWKLSEKVKFSLQILEKKQFENKLFQTEFKQLKFKILYNQKNNLKNIQNSKINNREILKTLYLINYEENLGHNTLNKSNANLINSIKLYIDDYTAEETGDNPTFKTIYNQTFSINMLYKLYKLKKFK